MSDKLQMGSMEGNFYIGKVDGDKMVDTMVFMFQQDKDGGVSTHLVNPIPLSFVSADEKTPYRPIIKLDKFSYLIDIENDIASSQGLVDFYHKVISDDNNSYNTQIENSKEL